MRPRNHYQDHYRKQHRLAIHAGVLALRRQSKRRLSKAFWAAGTGLAIAVFLLGGLLLNIGDGANQSAKAPLQPAHQTTPVSSSNPVTATEPLPVVETPVPKPTPKPKPVTPAPAKQPISTSINIVGNDECRSDTLDALQLLSEKAPSHYATVTKYVGVIECVTQGSGMAAYETPPRYMAGDVTRNAGTMWYAGTIAHDAGHSKLYNDYLAAHPNEGVPADIWTGQNAEAACLDAQYDALQQMGADQATLDTIKNAINTQYWNVPYDQRWW